MKPNQSTILRKKLMFASEYYIKKVFFRVIDCIRICCFDVVRNQCNIFSVYYCLMIYLISCELSNYSQCEG